MPEAQVTTSAEPATITASENTQLPATGAIQVPPNLNRPKPVALPKTIPRGDGDAETGAGEWAAFVQDHYWSNMVEISHNLLKMTPLREPLLQSTNTWTPLDLVAKLEDPYGGEYRLEALIGYMVGNLAPEPCWHCCEGKPYGPFARCIVVEWLAAGACMNCLWSWERSQCSFCELSPAPVPRYISGKGSECCMPSNMEVVTSWFTDTSRDGQPSATTPGADNTSLSDSEAARRRKEIDRKFWGHAYSIKLRKKSVDEAVETMRNSAVAARESLKRIVDMTSEFENGMESVAEAITTLKK